MISTIGLVAGTLTALCFVPQVFRVLMTRDTKGISLLSYLLLLMSMILWAIYGTMLHNIIIICSNTINICLAGIITYIKVKNLLSGKDKLEYTNIL